MLTCLSLLNGNDSGSCEPDWPVVVHQPVRKEVAHVGITIREVSRCTGKLVTALLVEWPNNYSPATAAVVESVS